MLDTGWDALLHELGTVISMRLISVLLCLALLGGCGELFRLRDDYMGKTVLQPDQVAQPVPRDERGDAVLKPE